MLISRLARSHLAGALTSLLLAAGCGGASSGGGGGGVDATPRIDAGAGGGTPDAMLTPPTFVVCPIGSAEAGCDYFGGDGLADAVEAAPTGGLNAPEVIAIRAGDYTRTPALEVTSFVRNDGKHLEIRGERGVVLDGGGALAGFTTIAGSTRLVSLRLDNFTTAASASGVSAIQLVDVTGRGGGAAVVLSESATGLVSGCDFASSTASTLRTDGASQLVVTGTRVSLSGNNAASARGTSSIKITNSILHDNVARGIYLAETASVIAVNNVFDRNAIAGIDAYHCGEHNPTMTLTNNVFTNTARNGDATFGYGIGGSCADGPGKKDNDTVAYNNSFGNEAQGTGCAGAEYCGGTGNTEIDPSFANAVGGDYHLAPTSQVRDSGDPAVLDPDGSRSDLGAYGGPGACGLDPTLPGC